MSMKRRTRISRSRLILSENNSGPIYSMEELKRNLASIEANLVAAQKISTELSPSPCDYEPIRRLAAESRELLQKARACKTFMRVLRARLIEFGAPLGAVMNLSMGDSDAKDSLDFSKIEALAWRIASQSVMYSDH